MSGDRDMPPGGPTRTTLFFKRMFDLAISIPSLIVLLPVLAGFAVAVRMTSPGPALFRQDRVGKGGKPFRICKFRTMVVDAPRLGTALTTGADPRITRIGAFLRKWKIDELPQLFNVVAGQMSFVGPRPEVPEYMAYYSEEQRRIITAMTPGITDYAAIVFRNESELLHGVADPVETYRREIMPAKFRLYEKYYHDIGVINDLRLIVATIAVLFSPRVLDWFDLAHDPAAVLSTGLAGERESA